MLIECSGTEILDRSVHQYYVNLDYVLHFIIVKLQNALADELFQTWVMLNDDLPRPSQYINRDIMITNLFW